MPRTDPRTPRSPPTTVPAHTKIIWLGPRPGVVALEVVDGCGLESEEGLLAEWVLRRIHPVPGGPGGPRQPRTTLYARHLIVTRHQAGRAAARIAEQLGISRATVHKWLARHHNEGPSGLADRSSRPRHNPARLDTETEARILRLPQQLRRGPLHLTQLLGLAASIVGRVLRRHHVPHLATLEAITGLPVRRRHSDRRYERDSPGELLHIDVKKLGRIPDGGGWRAVCAALGLRRRFIKPRCPWTNGKAERFNRTRQTEFAGAQAWISNQDRLDALPGWVQQYNTQRAHSALAGRPPISRLAL